MKVDYAYLIAFLAVSFFIIQWILDARQEEKSKMEKQRLYRIIDLQAQLFRNIAEKKWKEAFLCCNELKDLETEKERIEQIKTLQTLLLKAEKVA